MHFEKCLSINITFGWKLRMHIHIYTYPFIRKISHIFLYLQIKKHEFLNLYVVYTLKYILQCLLPVCLKQKNHIYTHLYIRTHIYIIFKLLKALPIYICVSL